MFSPRALQGPGLAAESGLLHNVSLYFSPFFRTAGMHGRLRKVLGVLRHSLPKQVLLFASSLGAEELAND